MVEGKIASKVGRLPIKLEGLEPMESVSEMKNFPVSIAYTSVVIYLHSLRSFSFHKNLVES